MCCGITSHICFANVILPLVDFAGIATLLCWCFDLEEWRLQVDLFKNIQLPYGMVVIY